MSRKNGKALWFPLSRWEKRSIITDAYLGEKYVSQAECREILAEYNIFPVNGSFPHYGDCFHFVTGCMHESEKDEHLKRILDGLYVPEGGIPRKGDIVVYGYQDFEPPEKEKPPYSANPEILHFGVVESAKNGSITVISRWGEMGSVFRHEVSMVPLDYGSFYAFSKLFPEENSLAYKTIFHKA